MNCKFAAPVHSSRSTRRMPSSIPNAAVFACFTTDLKSRPVLTLNKLELLFIFLFFCLDAKEPKNQGCSILWKLSRFTRYILERRLTPQNGLNTFYKFVCPICFITSTPEYKRSFHL